MNRRTAIKLVERLGRLSSDSGTHQNPELRRTAKSYCALALAEGSKMAASAHQKEIGEILVQAAKQALWKLDTPVSSTITRQEQRILARSSDLHSEFIEE